MILRASVFSFSVFCENLTNVVDFWPPPLLLLRLLLLNWQSSPSGHFSRRRLWRLINLFPLADDEPIHTHTHTKCMLAKHRALLLMSIRT